MEDVKYKILVVGDATCPHVRLRSEIFRKLGHEVCILTLNPSKTGKCKELYPGSFNNIKNNTLKTLLQIWNVIKILRKAEADIVHVHYAAGLLAWITAFAARPPIVVSTMGGDVLFEEQADFNYIEKALVKGLLNISSCITVKSSFLRQQVESISIDAAKIVEINWGINKEIFCSTPKSSIQNPIIFSPRILQPFYRIHIVVRVFARIVESFPTAKLYLATMGCDPNYMNQIKADIANAGLQDKVTFLDKLNYSEMSKQYQQAALTMSLAESDGVPQSLLESIACSTPVLANDLPQYRQFFQQGAGIVLSDPSVDKLVNNAIKLLSDLKFRRKVVEAGNAYIKNYPSLIDQARNLEASYRQIINTVNNNLKIKTLKLFQAVFFILHLVREICEGLVRRVTSYFKHDVAWKTLRKT